MKNSELRALSMEELQKKLVVEKENLEKLIFSHAATPIENPMRIKVARRFVARIKTEISNKALKANKMERNLRKQREGIVTSNKMDKTITVEVLRRVKHPIYGKFVKKTSKLTAHDEQNQCDIGDLVRVMETRPISKNKRWRLTEIVEKVK